MSIVNDLKAIAQNLLTLQNRINEDYDSYKQKKKMDFLLEDDFERILKEENQKFLRKLENKREYIKSQNRIGEIIANQTPFIKEIESSKLNKMNQTSEKKIESIKEIPNLEYSNTLDKNQLYESKNSIKSIKETFSRRNSARKKSSILEEKKSKEIIKEDEPVINESNNNIKSTKSIRQDQNEEENAKKDK